jgi:uncharacterized protein (TIGR03067 family)
VKTNVLLAMMTVLLLAAAPKDAAREDRDRLQGTWTVVESEKNGTPTPKDDLKKTPVKLTFHGDKLVVRLGEQKEAEQTFTLDPGKNPKQIDVTPAAKGIYEIDGDTLRLRFFHEGKERPKGFKSKTAPGESFLILKRDKGE